MEVLDQIIGAIEREKFAIINVSIYNNKNVMVDSYDVWFDHDVTLYCLQKLYVNDGKIDEIGDTISCNIIELERELLSICEKGYVKRMNRDINLRVAQSILSW